MTITATLYRIRIANINYSYHITKKQKYSEHSKQNNDQNINLIIILLLLISMEIYAIGTIVYLKHNNFTNIKNTHDCKFYDNKMVASINIGHLDILLKNSHKKQNKYMRAYNGNKNTANQINILHCNKGNSNFESKLNKIREII